MNINSNSNNENIIKLKKILSTNIEYEFLENKVQEYIKGLYEDVNEYVKNSHDNIMNYLLNEVLFNYEAKLYDCDNYVDIKLLTIDDLVKIAENMCNLYYFNEGANEIIDDNISDYLYRNCVKAGCKL